MEIDIPLAGWVLSVVTFALGTVFPVVFRRLSYEGLSLRQPFDILAVSQNDEDQRRCELVFSTLVKVANAGKDSLIIDHIEARSLGEPPAQFIPLGVDLRAYEPGEPVHMPPHTSPDGEMDYLPLLVKGETERVICLGLWFRYSATTLAEPLEAFTKLAQTPGVKVYFRVNGKYRRYFLHAKRFERWEIPPEAHRGPHAS
jgi:hypothetical protein